MSKLSKRQREGMEFIATKAHDAIYPHCQGAYWLATPWDSQQTPWLITRTGGWKLDENRSAWTKFLGTTLNQDPGEDGLWVVGWTDWDLARAEPRRLLMAFFDLDGDMTCLVDAEDPWPVMIPAMHEYVHQAHQALATKNGMLKDVGIEARHKILAAKGQESANPNVFPDTMPFD